MDETVNTNVDNHEDPVSTYGILNLFQFTRKLDVILLSVGTVFSVIHGAGFPVLALVFGQMTDTFLTETTNVNNRIDTGANLPAFTNLSSPNTDQVADTTFDTNLSKNNTSTNDLASYTLLYVYIGIVVFLAAFIQTLCWELSCERQVHQIRMVTFTHLLRQEISWYDTRRSTNLSNILSDDVERIREGIGSKFSMVTQYLSTFISGILVGVIVNWKLTGILLLVAPLLIGSSAFLAKLTASSAAREQLKYGRAGAVAEEVLTCVQTVAAFGHENSEVMRYESALEVGRKLAMKKYLVLAWGLSVVFFLMYSQYGLALYYGAALIQEGYCTPGSVFTVFFSVLSGAFTLGNALPYLSCVATALGSSSAVLNVINRTSLLDPDNDSGIKPTSFGGHVQFKNVHFSYPSRPHARVMKGLSLEIPAGKTVAIVGPSGCGKTTIFNLLLRFYDVTSGIASLDGIPLKDLNIRWLRSKIGLVPQEPALFGASIAENIRYGRESARPDDIESAAVTANAHGFIAELPQEYATCGAQLSGGQSQRVVLARALVREPELLLLDEATSALDAASERLVQEALERTRQGRTTVIIAHRLSTVRSSDIIYALQDGVVVERGNHEELMARRGFYHWLVSTQAVFTPDDVFLTHGIDATQNIGVHYIFQPVNWLSVLPLAEPTVAERERRVDHASATASEPSLTPRENAWREVEARDITLCSLVRLHGPETRYLLAGLLGCVVGGAVMPVFAFFYGEVFETFTKSRENLMELAIFWSGMFVVLGVMAAVGIWLEVAMMTAAVERLVMRLRVRAFHNILRQPMGWFDDPRNSSGRLATRLARDAPLIKGAAGLRLGQLLSALVTLVLALTMALVIGWRLAIVLLLAVPLLTAAAYHQTSMLRRTYARDVLFMDDAGRIASECVKNIRSVQALCAEKLFVRQYADSLAVPFRESKKQAVVYSIMFALSQAVVYFMYAGAFRFGVYLMQIGEMTSSEIYRVFFALAFCAASVGTSAAYVQDYSRAKMAAQEIFRLIDRPSEIDSTSPLGLTPVIRGEVVFDDVCFHYPSRPELRVLRGVTLRVRRGQMLAVVGRSGCGKSTLVALLERFYRPTRGSITVDGVDIQDVNVHHLRRHIGLVTQEPLLFNRSIRDNIAYGLEEEPSAEEVVRAATVANCHSFISGLPQGYDTAVGEAGSQLSGGQKQRIAIARALIRDPRILLLDEATSALDAESEKVVEEALERAQQGRTCIVIAHRLSTVRHADVIAVLHRGKIQELGSHEQLERRRGLYYQLVRA